MRLQRINIVERMRKWLEKPKPKARDFLHSREGFSKVGVG